MIDLHCHSNFSDGLLSPQDLLSKALTANIKLLALTDHDTVEGLAPLAEAARGFPINIMNGIEVSVKWKKYTIHIIGLGIDPTHASIVAIIKSLKERRIERAKQIGLILENYGVSSAYQKACDVAGHLSVGRPHFAHVLVREGRVPDMQAAFKQYLAEGRVAFIPTSWSSLDDAIEAIVQSGGDAVIAHPVKYKLTRTKLQDLVKDFKLCGGTGMEVVSGDIALTDMQTIADMCVRFDLLASSGSDFHGEGISRIPLGRQRNLPENCTPIWQKWSINE